jgi:hypothetical protein
MPNVEKRNAVQDYDSPPNVATIDDLRRADELLRKLEERYFGRAFSHPGFPIGDLAPGC